MEWVERLYGQTVGLDTAPFIYFIEKHSTYHEYIRPFFEAVDKGHIQIVTSTITLLEVLIHPLRMGREDLASEYREILLHADHLDTISITPAISEQAAYLRSVHNLHTPDALQIATALHANAPVFLSNDNRLPQISDIEIFLLDEFKNE